MRFIDHIQPAIFFIHINDPEPAGQAALGLLATRAETV